MKPRIINLFVVVASFLAIHDVFAQGTSFTYQGKLGTNGSAVTGLYDFRFRVASDSLGSNYVGSAFLTNGVGVTNGLFTVTVNFGTGIFTGSNLWFSTEVRTNGAGGYTALTPLQAITPAPYSIFAATASNVSGTISSSSISGTYGNAVTLNNSANQFSGSFFGNGANVTNVNAATLGGISSGGFWKTNGNSGANPTNGAFLGTTDNLPLQVKVNGVRVLRIEPSGASAALANGIPTGAPNIIGGAAINVVSPGVVGAVIGGGGATNYSGYAYTNSIAADLGTIGGGSANSILSNSPHSTIGGGYQNSIQALAGYSTISGGVANQIFAGASESVIAGGDQNTIQSPSAGVLTGFMNSIGTNSNFGVIVGGKLNALSNSGRGFIGNGVGNQLEALDSFIGAGRQNYIHSGAQNAVITGGGDNSIEVNAQYATISGGSGNVIQSNAQYSVVGGGEGQIVGTSSYAVIAGGNYNTIESLADFSTIGGGTGNQIAAGATASVIAGGDGNIIQSSDSAVLGGLMNHIWSNSNFGIIVGGKLNVMTNSVRGFIGNGAGNEIDAWDSFIGTGSQNLIQTSANNSVITGGGNNTIETSAVYATIGGGNGNRIQTNSQDSVIGGGYRNAIQTNAQYAVIPGGYSNVVSGNYSFAAGNNARATNNGTFVWSDGSGTLTTSTNTNSVTMRATGGYRFLTATTNAGVFLASGGSSWATISDQNAKKNRAPVSGQAVLEKLLAVPVEQWNYNWESDEATPNIGPMAQSFKAAFYPGRDDKSITTLEFDGVELAAIKGLTEQLKAKEARIADLEARLKRLEEIVSQSSHK